MSKIRLGMFAAIGAALLLFAPSAKAATYYFTGACFDCVGNGYGTLILNGYTEGEEIVDSNFVSWHYSSSIIPSWTIDSSNFESIEGVLGPNFPGPHTVTINSSEPPDFLYFYSHSGVFESWGVADRRPQDFGFSSSWDIVPFAAAVPIPGALPLFASGLCVLAWAARRKKQKQAAA